MCMSTYCINLITALVSCEWVVSGVTVVQTKSFWYQLVCTLPSAADQRVTLVRLPTLLTSSDSGTYSTHRCKYKFHSGTTVLAFQLYLYVFHWSGVTVKHERKKKEFIISDSDVLTETCHRQMWAWKVTMCGAGASYRRLYVPTQLG